MILILIKLKSFFVYGYFILSSETFLLFIRCPANINIKMINKKSSSLICFSQMSLFCTKKLILSDPVVIFVLVRPWELGHQENVE